MRRDRSTEQVILIVDVLVMMVSLLLTHLIHGRVAEALPGLKPPVELREYAFLLLLFLPTWVVAAERIGIHLHETLTGPRIDRVRLVLMRDASGAWGVEHVE